MADVCASSVKASASARGPSFIEGISKSSFVKQASDLKGSSVKVSSTSFYCYLFFMFFGLVLLLLFIMFFGLVLCVSIIAFPRLAEVLFLQGAITWPVSWPNIIHES